jgi:hypothetical protein
LLSDLVIIKIPKKILLILPTAPTRPAFSKKQSASNTNTSDINVLQGNTMSVPTCSLPPVSQGSDPWEPDVLDDTIIAKGTKEKRRILDATLQEALWIKFQ